VSPSASDHRARSIVGALSKPPDHVEGDLGSGIKSKARIVILTKSPRYSVGEQHNYICRPQSEGHWSRRARPLAEHTVGEFDCSCGRTEKTAADVTDPRDPAIQSSSIKPSDSGSRSPRAACALMQDGKRTSRLWGHCLRQPSRESRAKLNAKPMCVGAVAESINQGGKQTAVLRLDEDDVSGQGLAIAGAHVGARLEPTFHES